MAHKIVIDCGHGKSNDGSWDCGCTYNGMTEAGLMLPITKAAVKYLRYSGFNVLSDSDNGNNLNVIQGVKRANKEKAEIFMSIHCDYSGAPSGVYPLAYPGSSKGKKLATLLNTNIKNGMKMKSRGIGYRSDLAELSNTDMPAVILETGSISKDANIFKSKYDEYGKMIAKSVCEYFGVTLKTEKATASALTVNYIVTTNDKSVPCYKSHDTSNKVSNIKGIFTIVEEYGKFGKLKSGAGWVLLSDVKKTELPTAPTVTTVPKPVTVPKPATVSNKQKFLNALESYGKEIEKSFKYSNKNSKTTWASAKKNHITNCARYVSWCLQYAGILAKGEVIYWNGALKGSGASRIKKSTKIKRYKPNKTVKSLAKAGKLKAGDVCMFSNGKHTMVVRSVNKSTGAVKWYTAGPSDVKKHNVRNRRRSAYDKRKVSYLIRIK